MRHFKSQIERGRLRLARPTTLVALAGFLLCSVVTPAVVPPGLGARGPTETGIDVLIQQGFAPLKGKRVGLITNPTGVTRNLRATIDVLAHAPGVKLVALFGPEHGVRGNARAGETVADSRDSATGLPVYSLYGKTRKPTAAMLKGIDVLVFDMQDIGSRSYTYIATLANCMEGAGENGIPLIVLDRPNPLGGERIEGNIADLRFKSAVCPLPIPYCHGLTMGELAKMIHAGVLPQNWGSGGSRCDLTVIQMRGWKRSMTWPETGLPWVPTSPHVPHPETSDFYAATGIVGELPTVSIGVGYTLPFELVGRPGIDPNALANELKRRNLHGFVFRPSTWTPFYAVFKGESSGGVQIYITDSRRAELTRLNFEIMDAFRRISPGIKLFTQAVSNHMFDLVCGTDDVRRRFEAGATSAQMWARWNTAAAAFRESRKPYLLYD